MPNLQPCTGGVQKPDRIWLSQRIDLLWPQHDTASIAAILVVPEAAVANELARMRDASLAEREAE